MVQVGKTRVETRVVEPRPNLHFPPLDKALAEVLKGAHVSQIVMVKAWLLQGIFSAHFCGRQVLAFIMSKELAAWRQSGGQQTY